MIDESTAFCVANAGDSACYRNALRDALENRAQALEKANRAKERLREKFSKNAFERDMDVLLDGLLTPPKRGHVV